MRFLIRPLFALIAASSLAFAAEEPWLDDLAAAKARAKTENKPIFLYFTGSDWCGWCIRLDKEILKQAAFLDYAKEHLVLMEVDFPNKPENKKKQSAEVKAQNKALDKQFKIEGYPTIFLVDAELKQIAETEYREGGPEKYVAHLKDLLEKSKAKAPDETKKEE
jgi:protein disulfide-isomerase